MNPSSLVVYKKLKDSKVIRGLALKVYHYVAMFPRNTALDCVTYYKPRNRSSYDARYSDLVRMGLIKREGTKKQFGNNRDCFIITGSTDPIPLNRMTYKERFNILLKTVKFIKKCLPAKDTYQDVISTALNKVS